MYHHVLRRHLSMLGLLSSVRKAFASIPDTVLYRGHLPFKYVPIITVYKCTMGLTASQLIWQKDWDEREARLTVLVQNLNANLKGLSGNQGILNARLKGLEGQIRSLQELPGQLERLDRRPRDG